MEKRKFFIKLSSGDMFEISELDYNNLLARVNTGRTNGWYVQRGKSYGDRHDWMVQFSDVAGFWADKPELKDVTVKPIDVNKRKPKPVGKPKKEKVETCSHDWNNPETWDHVTTIVNGANRYFKQCPECNKKSPLIKKREVEIAQEAKGLTISDVPLVE